MAINLQEVISDCTSTSYQASLYFVFDNNEAAVIDIVTSNYNDYGEWRFGSNNEEMFFVRNISKTGREMLDSAPFQLPSHLVPKELNKKDFEDNSLAMGDFDWSNITAVKTQSGVEFYYTEQAHMMTFDAVMGSGNYNKKQKELVKIINYFVNGFYQ